MENRSLSEIISGIVSTYPSTYPHVPWKIANDARNTAPEVIRKLAHIPDGFQVYGGTGQGSFAQVPWIAILDKKITTSVQREYYIVYLFSSAGKGVYLSLNQGWTDYQNTYGVTKGRNLIRKTALYCRTLIRSSLRDFSVTEIDLDATTTLGRGYQSGHICGMLYPVNEIPADDVLANDLRNLMGVYAELKGFILTYNVRITGLLRVVEGQQREEEIAEDLHYQRKVEESEPQVIPPGPQPRPPLVHTDKGDRYRMNPRIARTVIIERDYSCEFDEGHRTFISKRTGHNYVETHHLVPMSSQWRFEHSLDVPDNIISLCPTCHRLFHHAVPDEKNQLVRHFYRLRKEQLKERGIVIGADELLEAYG